jgi:branched-chain amino acid transport system substrate-binding protein
MRPLRMSPVAGVIAATLILAACGASSSTGPSGGTFVLGIDGPMTGPQATTGTQIRQAVEMAFGNIHNQIGKYHVKLVNIDDQADPQVGTSALEQAIVGQGIQAAMGIWDTDVTVADLDVLARHHVPLLFSSTSGIAIDQKYKSDPTKYKYFLGKQYPPAGPLQTLYADAVNAYVNAHPGTVKDGKTVALCAENTDFGRGVVSALNAEFHKLDWSIMDTDYFDVNATDHYAMLQKFANDHVSVIACSGGSLPAMAALVKEARQIDPGALVVADGISYAGNWYQAVGSAGVGILDLGEAFTTSAAQQFVRSFRAKYGTDPGALAAGITYDYANFLIEVMKRAVAEYGSLTSDTLFKVAYNEVRTGKLQYTDGIMSRDYVYSPSTWPSPEVGPDKFFLPVVQAGQDGTLKVVYPPFSAQTSLQWPAAGLT